MITPLTWFAATPEARPSNLSRRLEAVTASIPHSDSTPTPEGKVCKKCEEWKPLERFPANKASRGGRQGICRQCSRNPEAVARAERRRYERHKEKIKARVKAWCEANKEHVKAEHHRRYVENKGQRQEQARDYISRNRDKVRETKRAYAERNADKLREWQRQYRRENAGRLAEQQRIPHEIY